MVLQKIKAILSMNGKGKGGPPDLDEVWRELTDKVKAAFGQSRGPGQEPPKNQGDHGGGFGSAKPTPPSASFPRLFGLIIGIG